MKKYLIRISGLGDIEFTVPVLKGRKSEILSKILFSLGVVSFFLLIAILPYSNLFTGKSFEQSSFATLILFMCSSIGFLGSFLLLQGKKVLVDPKYFLSVLLFALLTTAASVLKSPAHISNTFGIEVVRSLSGITIMALVGFYFLFNLLAKDFKTILKLQSTFKFSLVVLVLILIFHTNVTDLNFVNNNIAIVLFTYSYLTLDLIFSSKKVLKSILLAVSAIFVFLTPQTIPNAIFSTQVITTIVLSSLVLLLTYALLQIELVKKKFNDFKLLKNSFKDKKYSLSEVSYFLLLSVSVIAIVVGVLVHFKFNFTMEILTSPINNFLNLIKETVTGNINFQSLIIGNGSYNAASRVSNLNSSLSSITNVFVTQGLVGTLAYLFIVITSFVAIIKSIRTSLTLKAGRGLVFLSAFTIIFVSLYSLISYGGELFTIFFWFAFATLSSYLSLKDAKQVYAQKNWGVGNIFTKGKAGVYLRVVLSLLVLILAVLALVSFTRITV